MNITGKLQDCGYCHLSKKLKYLFSYQYIWLFYLQFLGKMKMTQEQILLLTRLYKKDLIQLLHTFKK